MVVSFPHAGDPIVSYKNGPGIDQRLARVLHTEAISQGWKRTTAATSRLRENSKTVMSAMHNLAGDVARPITLPAQNLGRFVPGGVALSDPDLKARVAEEKALREREAEIRRYQKTNALNDVDIPTLR